VRYARPRCDECVRLAAECQAIFQEYLSAKDDLAMTLKNDPTHLHKRRHLDTVTGQLREAHKREDVHEKSHQDEYAN